MSINWDDPEFAESSGEFIKFEKVGDSVAGHITLIGRKTWDDGSVCPQLDITTDDGEQKVLTAGATRLKRAIVEQRPEVGDHIAVTFTEIIKLTGNRTLKVFDVAVVRGGKKAATVAASKPAADDAPPF